MVQDAKVFMVTTVLVLRQVNAFLFIEARPTQLHDILSAESPLQESTRMQCGEHGPTESHNFL